MTQTRESTKEPWPAERLREARGILADVAHHPDTRVALAARVVMAHSPDENERTDARALQSVLESKPSSAAGHPGGAA